MSGLPASDPGGRLPSWTVQPWDSAYLDARDYQWNEVAIPFWKQIQARAADADVKVCIEMHPHNLAYNPATMERLATEIGATHVGAEMDPSHLFWQGIDPVAAVNSLGALVYNAAAKDTRINEAAKVNGVLDDRFGRVPRDAPGVVSLGGRYTLSRWPENASWDFVAVGRGHDVDWWADFLRALEKVDPQMAVNIEHEDQELDQMEGLRSAAAPPCSRQRTGSEGPDVTRVRWGVLSTARIGRVVARACRDSHSAEFVAVASRGAERARQFADQEGMPLSFGSYEELLACDAVDAVYIALPVSMHAEWTVRALAAGKDVLCEKPMSASSAKVEACFDAAERSGRQCFEGLMYRHHPQTRLVARMVADGDIGQLTLVRAVLSVSVGEHDIRRSPALDGGALNDLGCYCVSAIRLFAGRPLSIQA